MRSVADELARELVAQQRALSAGERVALSLRLGEDAVRLYAKAHGVSPEAARQTLRRNNAIGRRPSRCASEAP